MARNTTYELILIDVTTGWHKQSYPLNAKTDEGARREAKKIIKMRQFKTSETELWFNNGDGSKGVLDL